MDVSRGERGLDGLDTAVTALNVSPITRNTDIGENIVSSFAQTICLG